MIRARFKVNAEDYRPVEWPIKHPYWCTGYGGDDGAEYAIIVAYADEEEEIRRLWPDAAEVDSDHVDGYKFTDRFPRPDWLKDAAPQQDATNADVQS